MKDHDKNKYLLYHMNWDENGLHGQKMSQKLPINLMLYT